VRYDDSVLYPNFQEEGLRLGELASARSAADLNAPSRIDRPCYKSIERRVHQFVPELRKPLGVLKRADSLFRDPRNLRGVSAEVARQVLDEQYVTSWSSTASYGGVGSLDAWLRTTCSNKVFDYVRELCQGSRFTYTPRGIPGPRAIDPGNGESGVEVIEKGIRLKPIGPLRPHETEPPGPTVSVEQGKDPVPQDALNEQLDRALRNCVRHHLRHGKSPDQYESRLPSSIEFLAKLESNAIQMRGDPLVGLTAEWRNRVTGDRELQEALAELRAVPSEDARDILIDVVERFRLELNRELGRCGGNGAAS
jgi:hypothetical protein